jgi:arylsulfatase A-like enzyme
VVNRELIRWIDSNRRPFFAFINYFDVHEPYGGPRRFQKPWPENSAVDRYDDGIRYVDDAIGQLRLALEKRELSRDTIVVVTSDHGEGLGQHGLPTHGQALYCEQVHVPLIFWFPGHVPAGQRVSTSVTNTAIPATLMTLLDESAPPEFPGPPLNALWATPQSAPNWPDPLSELAQHKYLPRHNGRPESEVPTANTGSMKSLIQGRWQLIVHEKYGPQLYDRMQDPKELTNLAGTDSGQQTAQRLSARLREVTSQPLVSNAVKNRISVQR